MRPRTLLIAAVISGGFLFAAYLFFVRWTPEAASRRAHDAFITALAERDTSHLAGSISSGYADAWGMGKADLEEGFREALSGFISIVPEWEEQAATLEDDTEATFTGRLRIKGNALPLGQLVQSRLEATKTPFTFHWRREGAPWSWKLTRVENSGLRIPDVARDFVR